MFNQKMIQGFLDNKILNGASTETIRAYRSDLTLAHQVIGDTVAWDDTEKAFALYLNAERQVRSAKTVERRLGTFRSYGRWAGSKHLLPEYRPPKPAPPQPHPIAEGIDGVLRMIQSTRNPRHRALCVMTGLMGLRVNEAVSIRPEHIDVALMEMTVRGKGDKVRVVPISTTAWKYMSRAYHHAQLNGTTLVRLTNRGARASITRHAKRANLSDHVASHDMRSTALTAFYEKSKDLRAVQEIAGHADSKTTQAYTRISKQSMRAAMEVA